MVINHEFFSEQYKMDRDIEREYDKLVFNYKKLKEENCDLNKRLDELNRVITTNEERRRKYELIIKIVIT